MCTAAEIDLDLGEWNYGRYEGFWTAEIRAERPDWDLFRCGCRDGEGSKQVIARADRVIARVRAIRGDVLLFTCGQFTRVLAATWIGLEPISSSQCLMLNTASICALGYEPDLGRTVIRLWNDTSHLDRGTEDIARTASQRSKYGPFDWMCTDKKIAPYEHEGHHLDRKEVERVQYRVTRRQYCCGPIVADELRNVHIRCLTTKNSPQFRQHTVRSNHAISTRCSCTS